MHDPNISLSIVVSMFNEEQGIARFWEALQPCLASLGGKSCEVIWVNDGCSDKTQEIVDGIISNGNNPGVQHIAIEFSRNYGHEAAMIAGIDVASGDAVICMDSDLQHPPARIGALLAAFENGNDIVLMTRTKRADLSFVKKGFSALFYKMINHLSDYDFEHNSSDFFLVSRRVAEILRTNFRERNRFIRGYIQIIGFPKTTIEYDAPAREFGESNYSFTKLLKLSLNAVFSFSIKPLQFSVVISVVFIIFTLIVAAFSLYQYFFGDHPPSGYTTLIVFMSVCFSFLFLLIAILSVYFGKNLEETRQRPIYLVKHMTKSSKE
jgi:dolichol-phosphate mannosyltransferase